ncbi:DJ-1/PfpI family protein [Sphingobium sp. HBC34]|uniref:DJ-1/PfpI family protein n=2 Tax=Sphingobium cyanobacteriorum TaxID=3063954 RepID=A0ABT8ZQP4_9SPHN|nr:helix-turn-helix domain-containing protein [Sphingobium sp. HBC34]MDO7836274.1 DJ-1/PfpI family protein [Sphingobium sp. HBC34]
MTHSSDSPPTPQRHCRHIVLVGFAGVEPLDLIGPLSVFARAETLVPGSYSIRIAAPEGGIVVAQWGVSLAEVVPLDEIEGPIDTILLAGAVEDAIRVAATHHALVQWVVDQRDQTRRIGSICTGAFILGAAGLLDGRRATTHWAAAAELQRYFPAASVEPDAIYVIDGPLCTSAGVTAGIDLALALVEDDLGHAVATQIARDLVLFLRRPGGQRQFSATLATQTGYSDRFAELLVWMADNPAADLGVSTLAARSAMSERSFARRFARDVGQTPARHVLALRLEHACRLLETTSWPLDRIADRSGFRTADTFHRTFRQEIGLTPGSYRERHGARETHP